MGFRNGLQHKDDKVYRIVSKNDNNAFENWITIVIDLLTLVHSSDRIEKPLVKIEINWWKSVGVKHFLYMKKIHTQKLKLWMC